MMKNKLWRAMPACLMIAGMGAAGAFAEEYYVGGPGANDGNAGDSPGASVATLQQAILLANNGDTINVAAGTYVVTGVDVTKSLTILGPNDGVDPTNPDGSAAARQPEAVLQAEFNDTDANVYINAPNVTISGFTFEGYINDGTPDEPIGPDGVSPVGREYGIAATGQNFTARYNIFQNFAQAGVWDFIGVYAPNATAGPFEYNRGHNIGVPDVPGQGELYLAQDTFPIVRNNYSRYTRNGAVLQHSYQSNPGNDDIIFENNRFLDCSIIGLVLNGIRGDTGEVFVVNNTLDGISATEGTAGIYIVSTLENTATNRSFTIANNDIRQFPAGVAFANNDVTDPIRINGGTIDTVTNGGVFVNRYGYRGFFEVVSAPTLSGRDATGGPARFDPSGFWSGGSTLTADLQAPAPGDDETGFSPFTSTSFGGDIALLEIPDPGDCDVTVDLTTPVLHAQQAGASAVLFIETRNCSQFSGPSVPRQPRGTANSGAINIPSTSVSNAVGTALQNDLALGTVTLELNGTFIPNSDFGVPAPAIITNPTTAEFANVAISNVIGTGFVAVDFPANIAGGGTPGPVHGRLIGGSSVSNADRGAFAFGSNSTFETDSARFVDNRLGIEVQDATLNVDGTSFISNSQAGIRFQGNQASATVRNSDFLDQPVDIRVLNNPGNFSVENSNFDVTDIAVLNEDPTAADVSARSNWWGDPSGPQSIDGTPYNGTGAQVSDGVDATDYLSAEVLVADSDGDGLDDDEETTYGTDPTLRDTDGDGIQDGIEVRTGTDPLDPDDPADTTDADNDGLVASLDPNDNNKDTDDDGIADGFEVKRGTDPANRYEYPPFGDANADARVDNVDAVAVLEAFLGLRDFKQLRRPEIDVNQNGRIDNVDAIILFNYYIGNIPYIPYP